MANVNSLQGVLESVALANPGTFRVSSYSGRGMYGKECLSVSCSSLGRLFAEVIRVIDGEKGNLHEEVAEDFENMAQDSLGKGIVVYFPGVEYTSQDYDDDEEEGSGDENNGFVTFRSE